MTGFNRSFLVLLIICNFIYPINTFAEIIHAQTCSQLDVQAAINSANDGDVIVIPAGSCTWTSRVIVNKPVIVLGEGRYAIDYKHEDIGSWPLKITLSGNVGIEIQGSSNDYIRIKGIYFTGTTEGGWGPNEGGAIFVNRYNRSESWRVDNCKFDVSGSSIRVARGYGLIDSCYFYKPDCSTSNDIRVSNFLDSNGDSVWTYPPNFGSADFVFIENCIFWKKCNQSNMSPVAVDAQAGGKYVIRYCYLHDCFILNHGTESGAPQRGGYAFEIYENEFYWHLPSDRYHAAYFCRGGTMLMFNNKITNYQAMWKTWVRRANQTWGRFGQCDGTQSHDGNLDGYPPGYP